MRKRAALIIVAISIIFAFSKPLITFAQTAGDMPDTVQPVPTDTPPDIIVTPAPETDPPAVPTQPPEPIPTELPLPAVTAAPEPAPATGVDLLPAAPATEDQPNQNPPVAQISNNNNNKSGNPAPNTIKVDPPPVQASKPLVTPTPIKVDTPNRFIQLLPQLISNNNRPLNIPALPFFNCTPYVYDDKALLSPATSRFLLNIGLSLIFGGNLYLFLTSQIFDRLFNAWRTSSVFPDKLLLFRPKKWPSIN